MHDPALSILDLATAIHNATRMIVVLEVDDVIADIENRDPDSAKLRL